jgi:VIT1/CCC1 family predicted Fe2+/Mn2+ transporter
LFIIAAIFGAVSMSTGEGAEEIAEKLPEVTHQIIHEHEELAEKLIIFLYILGVTSIVGLYFNLKKHSKASIFSYLVAIISLATVYLAKETGTTGGEIRHTEIRNDSGIQQATSENLNEDKD